MDLVKTDIILSVNWWLRNGISNLTGHDFPDDKDLYFATCFCIVTPYTNYWYAFRCYAIEESIENYLNGRLVV